MILYSRIPERERHAKAKVHAAFLIDSVLRVGRQPSPPPWDVPIPLSDKERHAQTALRRLAIKGFFAR